MPLIREKATAEELVCTEVERALRAGLDASGRVTLLVPSFAQALEAQRALAERDGLSLGVTVSTPAAWATERWEVWGDGRRLVDATARDVLCARVLSRAAARPGSVLRDNPGTAALLADLVRVGMPWLEEAADTAPEGVSEAERALVGLVRAYADELSVRGLVEGATVMAELSAVLDATGAEVAPLVLVGFGPAQAERPVRALVEGLAVAHEVTVVEPCAVGAGAGAGAAAGAGNPDAPARAPELQALLGALFVADAPAVRPTGAVRLLLPSGPSAEPALVADELASLARGGAEDLVLVASDAPAAWRALAPRLVARGLAAKAELSVPFGSLEAGRAFLELARSVARLAELDADWPEPTAVEGGVRVELREMSWWPPRELSDFLLSEISHVDAARARRLDAAWRGNRLLTPGVVLSQLTSERDTSPECAAAVRELLRGRLGSAASKLLAPFVRGEKGAAAPAPDGPEAAPDGPDAPATPDRELARTEAVSALTAVLSVARSLKELGLTADPVEPGALSLSELVAVAASALERTQVVLRPELRPAAPGAAAPVVRVMSASSAARLAPRSADALVLLGQTSAESAIPAPDDVRSALLSAYGVEPRPDAMARARERFRAIVRVPRRTLALERLLFGADGKPCYPSVMLTELLACYGVSADAPVAELAAAFGTGGVRTRGEERVRENGSPSGRPPTVAATELPAPAGKILPEAAELVSPPPEGVDREERPLLSASQIETYLECPYKWFSLRRLRLRDADALFSGAEMGTFAHRVLEVTHAELLARAFERQHGGSRLARLRAQVPDATQTDAYRTAVAELLACAQAAPAARVPGSSTHDAAALEEATQILSDEFDAHLSHQYQLMGRARRPLPQALVAHTAQDEGRLQGLRRDLTTLLGFEGQLLVGFEPRFFEWSFGRGADEVEYAGVRLTGTVDRIDVNAHGQAVVIDYKHKSDAGFAGEYDAFPKEGAEKPGAAPSGGAAPATFALPRRVQALIYAQVVRRTHPELTVRGAVYLCTKGGHALAGAVDEEALENVFGTVGVGTRREPRVAVPRAARFGQRDASGMEALLDATEEAIAARLSRLVAGDIEADPLDDAACQYCPVLNCERRRPQ